MPKTHVPTSSTLGTPSSMSSTEDISARTLATGEDTSSPPQESPLPTSSQLFPELFGTPLPEFLRILTYGSKGSTAQDPSTPSATSLPQPIITVVTMLKPISIDGQIYLRDFKVNSGEHTVSLILEAIPKPPAIKQVQFVPDSPPPKKKKQTVPSAPKKKPSKKKAYKVPDDQTTLQGVRITKKRKEPEMSQVEIEEEEEESE